MLQQQLKNMIILVQILVFHQKPTEFADTLREIILRDDFKGFVVEYYHSENVHVPVPFDSWIEVGRRASNFANVAIRRKLSMECLSTGCI